MGGLGSGRPEIWPSLWTLYSIRTKQVRLACDFCPGMRGHVSFKDGIRIEVETTDGIVLVNGVSITVAYSKPHLGGRRAWFLCPNVGCARRCTVVYGRAQQWACRRCWRANYPSQKEARFDRLLRKAKHLRHRLHDFTEMAPADHIDRAGFPPDKPPHMHWSTYSRLASELQRVEMEAAKFFIDHSTHMLERLKR